MVYNKGFIGRSDLISSTVHQTRTAVSGKPSRRSFPAWSPVLTVRRSDSPIVYPPAHPLVPTKHSRNSLTVAVDDVASE